MNEKTFLYVIGTIALLVVAWFVVYTEQSVCRNAWNNVAAYQACRQDEACTMTMEDMNKWRRAEKLTRGRCRS